jgi:hypothetical protein
MTGEDAAAWINVVVLELLLDESKSLSLALTVAELVI